MSKRDYYEILEVSVTATFQDIKSAYRRQARKYHPDLNPGNGEAERLFKEVNEAFDVLKDPDKRAAYDQFGHDAFAQGGGGRGGFEEAFGAGLGDLFEQMFGGARGRRPQKGEDLQIRIDIPLKRTFTGTTESVTVHSPVPCGACHGTGSKSDRAPTTCARCRGRGAMRVQNGFFVSERPCPACDGTGAVVDDPCNQCHGRGIFEDARVIDIKIPAGIEDQSHMLLRGQGNPGLHNLPNGDLHVFVSVRGDKAFERDGADLHARLEISMSLAALGGETEMAGIDGRPVAVSIAPGTQGGDVVAIRSQGFTILNSAARGRLHVHIKVATPRGLTARQRELLEELEEEELRKDNGLLNRTKSSLLGRKSPKRKSPPKPAAENAKPRTRKG